ncbi:hypothetical protein M3J09_009146 [Ascochyta lentis]
MSQEKIDQHNHIHQPKTTRLPSTISRCYEAHRLRRSKHSGHKCTPPKSIRSNSDILQRSNTRCRRHSQW